MRRGSGWGGGLLSSPASRTQVSAQKAGGLAPGEGRGWELSFGAKEARRRLPVTSCAAMVSHLALQTSFPL